MSEFAKLLEGLPGTRRKTPEGKPIIENDDGSFSTERSITVEVADLNDGKPTNIPTIWDGKQLGEQEAIGRAIKSGQTFPSFGSIDEAVAAAKRRSDDIGRSMKPASAFADLLEGLPGQPKRKERKSEFAELVVPLETVRAQSESDSEAITETLKDTGSRFADIGRGAANLITWPARASVATVLATLEAIQKGTTADFPDALATFTESGHLAYKGPKDIEVRAPTPRPIPVDVDEAIRRASQPPASVVITDEQNRRMVDAILRGQPGKMEGGQSVAIGELPEYLLGKFFEKGGEAIHQSAENLFEKGLQIPRTNRSIPRTGPPIATGIGAGNPELATGFEVAGNALLLGSPLALGRRGREGEPVRPAEPARVVEPEVQTARGVEAPSMARLDRAAFEVRQPVEVQAGPRPELSEFAKLTEGLERPNRDVLRELERKAIEENRPEEALEAARARIEEPGPREEWQRTQAEHVVRYTEGQPREVLTVLRDALREDHREVVREAVARGESVPARVLADYPDLKAGAFRPSAEWQRVPEGAVLPPGLEIRMNTTTGVNEARLKPGAGPAASGPVAMPGMNYTGFVNDASQAVPGAGARAAAKPIRREDILAPFLKAIGVPIYEGRIKGKGTMGLYWPTKEAVRIKRKSDIETAAHELAHYIDDKLFEGFAGRRGGQSGGSRPWVRGPNHRVYAQELASVSYDAKKVYEGFAEFVRLWMTQTDVARTKAPQFFAWWEKFVNDNSHKWGPAMRKAQEGMTAWFAQDALSRAKSKIGAARDINEGVDSIFSKFRQSVFDDLEGIRRMEQDLTGKTAPVGAYESARLTRAAYSMVEGTLTIGRIKRRPDGSFTFEGKGLKQILDSVAGELDSYLLYAVGKSAQELRQQGREKLFTEGEINAMVSLETPRFKQAFADYQEWNRATVQFAQDLGLIDPQSRRLWQRAQYMPFYRATNPASWIETSWLKKLADYFPSLRANQRGATKRAGGIEGNWSGIKKLTGGTDNIRDVLGNMIQNSATLITAALKNEARQKVAKLADDVRGGGRFMQEIAKDNKKVKVRTEDVLERIYESFGLNYNDVKRGNIPPGAESIVRVLEQLAADNPGFLDFWTRGHAPMGDNIMAVLYNGKPSYYEVIDPVLYRAISSLNRESANWLIRFLNGGRRIVQGTITLAPDFMAANIARDTLLGSILSRHGFKPFVDSVRGMKSRLLRDENYQEFVANGGGFSSYLVDEAAFRKHLERFYTKKGIDYRTVADSPAKLLYFLESLTDAFEMSTRLGEFRQARAKGAHPRHAAYEAREVSTDFAMRGDSQALGFMYDSVLFLKAGMNGLDRGYRGLFRDQNRIQVAAKTGLLAMMSVALYAHNRDNPRYQQLEDWDRDTHWHFFIPTPGGEDLHFRYPKIWEVGAVASTAERTFEHLLDGEWKRYAKEVGKIIKNLFNFEYIPAVIAPIYEVAINRNRFTDRPIHTLEMERLQPFARSSPYTSRSMEQLGLASRDWPVQIDPAITESLLRGYFNTWAVYGLSAADAAAFDDAPSKRLDQYPVIRRFFQQEPARHTKYERQFYEMLKEATQLRMTMRAMERGGNVDIADELDRQPETEAAGQLERANKRIQALTREIKATYQARELSAEGKRKQIDELIQERNELYKGIVLDVEDSRRGIGLRR